MKRLKDKIKVSKYTLMEKTINTLVVFILFISISFSADYLATQYRDVEAYIEFDQLSITDYQDGHLTLQFDREIKTHIDNAIVNRKIFLVKANESKELVDSLTRHTLIAVDREGFTYDIEIELQPGEYYVIMSYTLNLQYGITKDYQVTSNIYLIE